MTNEEHLKDINEKIQKLKDEELLLIKQRNIYIKDINKIFSSIVGNCYRNKSGCYLITNVPQTHNLNTIPCVIIDFIDYSICEDELYVPSAGRCDTEEELFKLMNTMFEEITVQQFKDEALELMNSFISESWEKKKEYKNDKN